MSEHSKLMKISIIVSILLSITLIVSTSLDAYVTYTTSFQASMGENGEGVDIAIKADSGRPTTLEKLFQSAKNWFSSYYVGGVEKTDAETGISISVTGSNVASQASVNYYIEGVPQSGGQPYKFLEGNGTSVTVGGAALSPSNQTTIENHLQAMGLSITASHTIDYYVYVEAEVTGVVSGDTLTSTIEYTKFDTVRYEYGALISETWEIEAAGDDVSTRPDLTWKPSYAQWRVGDVSDDGVNLDWTSALRFNNITIAQGTSIDSANIDVYSVNDKTMDIYIYGEDTTNAAQITSGSDFYSRTRTSQSVTWSETFDTSQWFTTPDMSAIIEELVDQGSWSSGNSMQFFFNESAGFTGAYLMQGGAYEGTYPARLDVNYMGYAASWYEIPPLSVVSLPVAKNAAAVVAVIIAILVVVRTKKKEDKKK